MQSLARLSGPRTSRCRDPARGRSAPRAGGRRCRTGRPPSPGRSRPRRERRPRTCSRTMAFVAAWAFVGPSARRCAYARAAASKPSSGRTRLTTPQRSSVACVVEVAGHDELPRPRRARALREPLRPAHRRGQADHGLDEPEPRRVGGDEEVAGEAQLEGGRKAEAVGREHGRERQLLDGVDHREQVGPQLRGVGDAEPVEDVDVTPPLTILPSARMSRPRGWSAATSSTAPRTPSIIAWSKRFSGGLSSVRTASAPSRSRRTAVAHSQARSLPAAPSRPRRSRRRRPGPGPTAGAAGRRHSAG